MPNKPKFSLQSQKVQLWTFTFLPHYTPATIAPKIGVALCSQNSPLYVVMHARPWWCHTYVLCVLLFTCRYTILTHVFVHQCSSRWEKGANEIYQSTLKDIMQKRSNSLQPILACIFGSKKMPVSLPLSRAVVHVCYWCPSARPSKLLCSSDSSPDFHAFEGSSWVWDESTPPIA